jgi:hypothetical protein
MKKKGITPEALVACGARMASMKMAGLGEFHLIVLPAFDPIHRFDVDPRGWVAYNRTGADLPVFVAPGKPPESVKIKTLPGSKSGWMGRDALESLETAEVVWKVEGPSDMLALWSIIPPELRGKHVVITNANGANEHPSDEMVYPFAGKIVFVLHDADKPGQGIPTKDEEANHVKGAKLWCQEFARKAKEVRNVQLPFPIADDHGKDLRDWINEGGTYEQLLALASEAEIVAPPPPSDPVSRIDAIASICNYTLIDGDAESAVPLTMSEVCGLISKATGGWPRRVGSSLFVRDEAGVHWLAGTSGLFGWLARRCGIVAWRKIIGAVTKEETHAELQRTSPAYVAVETLPHVPPMRDHYYAHDPITPGDVAALAGLLDRFSYASDIDRDLLQAALMTILWGGTGGSRPAFLITTDDGRGVGKSKMAQMIAYVFGGALDFSSNDDIAKIKTRLLTTDALAKRIAVLDNIKSSRFSWAELEALITSPTISGHRMYCGDAERPNTLTWIVTLNGPSVSTDLATRLVTIKVKRPQHSGDWEDSTRAYVDQHRDAIIADLVAAMAEDPTQLDRYSRWGSWEREVLSRLPEPSEAQKIIAERQQEMDAEGDEGEMFADYVEARLRDLGYDTRESRVFIPVKIIALWWRISLNEQGSDPRVVRQVNQLVKEGRLPRLASERRAEGRGYIWSGQDSITCHGYETDLINRLNGAGVGPESTPKIS